MSTADPHEPEDCEWSRQRRHMVEAHLEQRGIDDQAVLDAFARVPRHLFVPAEDRTRAYVDHPLPIGCEQTISQPYVVACMLQVLKLDPAARVLEIGTGSGYQTALLSELVHRVYTVEFFAELSRRARKILSTLNCDNVELRIGDGALGWPEKGPFDAIVGSAAAPEVPPALAGQLAAGGRLILPVGTHYQHLVLLARTPSGFERTTLNPVRFVPMRC